MKLPAGHLTYCTNIHAGELWDDHFASLKEHFPSIKTNAAKNSPMGIGLRLSNAASMDLQNPEKLEEFKAWLFENDAYVFTMNGFPYGEFHNAPVKDQVHAPDWTTTERFDYTMRMFGILADLLPAGMDGGISTSPLSYRYWYVTNEESADAVRIATDNILRVVEYLFELKKGKNVLLHLDIEPEPDGMLETGHEFISWYENILLPAARNTLGRSLNLSSEQVDEVVRQHITLCYDVCHFAIGYEDHEEILAQLAERQIHVGKIQISAALKAVLPDDAAARKVLSAAFSNFNEPIYLHQVVARQHDGQMIRYRDLPDALTDIENPTVTEWRAHFHVPVFLEQMGSLKSTQSEIEEVLSLQQKAPFTSHMEVETYTWEVLPDTLKLPMDQSISRELNWIKAILNRNE